METTKQTKNNYFTENYFNKKDIQFLLTLLKLTIYLGQPDRLPEPQALPSLFEEIFCLREPTGT